MKLTTQKLIMILKKEKHINESLFKEISKRENVLVGKLYKTIRIFEDASCKKILVASCQDDEYVELINYFDNLDPDVLSELLKET